MSDFLKINQPLRTSQPIDTEIPITRVISSFFTGDTTPTVRNCNVYKSPAGATTVTDFDDAAEGQCIQILGNGNLTVSNNANIKTNTGANKVLVADKIYTFTHIMGVWYENE